MKLSRDLRLGFAACFIFIGASVFAASAFFTDISSFAPRQLRTASIGFGYPKDKIPEDINTDKDFSVIADFGDHNEKLSPYREGDIIELCFSTFVSGSVPSIVIPRLEVISEGLGTDGVISVAVSEGESEAGALGRIEGKDGSSFFHGPISRAEPGDEKVYRYRISIEKLSEDVLLILDFDFSICAVQLKGNEELLEDGISPEEAFDSIYDAFKGNDTDETPDSGDGVEGFTEYTDLSDAVEPDGEDAGASASRRIAMELGANVSSMGSDTGDMTWYQLIDGERKLLCVSGVDDRITVLINERTAQYGICYELLGRAGSICSDIYGFDYNEGAPLLKKMEDQIR